jgi:hypothetical protein
MPKSSAIKMVRRWIALDAKLATRGGIRIEDFAREQAVSTKTIRRDLDVFRALEGQAAMEVVKFLGKDGHWHWCYARGIPRHWLFACNKPQVSLCE